MTGRPRPVPQLMSTTKAGRRLGISDDTIRAWIDAGDLEAVNIATKPGDVRWAVSEEALAACVGRRTRRVRRVTTA